MDCIKISLILLELCSCRDPVAIQDRRTQAHRSGSDRTKNRAVTTRLFFSPTLTEHLLTPPATYYFHCLTHSYKSTCNPQQSMKSQHNRRTVGPENIEQEYRGRLGTLCSANIDHRYHHSICHGQTTLNGLSSPSSHLNYRQSTKFSICKNMFSVRSSSRNANPTARLPPPTTPTSLHLSPHNPANPHAVLNLP